MIFFKKLTLSTFMLTVCLFHISSIKASMGNGRKTMPRTPLTTEGRNRLGNSYLQIAFQTNQQHTTSPTLQPKNHSGKLTKVDPTTKQTSSDDHSTPPISIPSLLQDNKSTNTDQSDPSKQDNKDPISSENHSATGALQNQESKKISPSHPDWLDKNNHTNLTETKQGSSAPPSPRETTPTPRTQKVDSAIDLMLSAPPSPRETTPTPRTQKVDREIEDKIKASGGRTQEQKTENATEALPSKAKADFATVPLREPTRLTMPEEPSPTTDEKGRKRTRDSLPNKFHTKLSKLSRAIDESGARIKQLIEQNNNKREKVSFLGPEPQNPLSQRPNRDECPAITTTESRSSDITKKWNNFIPTPVRSLNPVKTKPANNEPKKNLATVGALTAAASARKIPVRQLSKPFTPSILPSAQPVRPKANDVTQNKSDDKLNIEQRIVNILRDDTSTQKHELYNALDFLPATIAAAMATASRCYNGYSSKKPTRESHDATTQNGNKNDTDNKESETAIKPEDIETLGKDTANAISEKGLTTPVNAATLPIDQANLLGSHQAAPSSRQDTPSNPYAAIQNQQRIEAACTNFPVKTTDFTENSYFDNMIKNSFKGADTKSLNHPAFDNAVNLVANQTSQAQQLLRFHSATPSSSPSNPPAQIEAPLPMQAMAVNSTYDDSFMQENSSTPKPISQQEAARRLFNVSKNATEKEVKEAYKRAIMKAHPDQGGTKREAMKIIEARDCLLKRSNTPTKENEYSINADRARFPLSLAIQTKGTAIKPEDIETLGKDTANTISEKELTTPVNAATLPIDQANLLGSHQAAPSSRQDTPSNPYAAIQNQQRIEAACTNFPVKTTNFTENSYFDDMIKNSFKGADTKSLNHPAFDNAVNLVANQTSQAQQLLRFHSATPSSSPSNPYTAIQNQQHIEAACTNFPVKTTDFTENSYFDDMIKNSFKGADTKSLNHPAFDNAVNLVANQTSQAQQLLRFHSATPSSSPSNPPAQIEAPLPMQAMAVNSTYDDSFMQENTTTPKPMSLQEAARLFNVSKNATEKEVKEAYKRAIMKAHPDQGGTNREMIKIIEARDCLLKRSNTPTKENEYSINADRARFPLSVAIQTKGTAIKPEDIETLGKDTANTISEKELTTPVNAATLPIDQANLLGSHQAAEQQEIIQPLTSDNNPENKSEFSTLDTPKTTFTRRPTIAEQTPPPTTIAAGMACWDRISQGLQITTRSPQKLFSRYAPKTPATLAVCVLGCGAYYCGAYYYYNHGQSNDTLDKKEEIIVSPEKPSDAYDNDNGAGQKNNGGHQTTETTEQAGESHPPKNTTIPAIDEATPPTAAITNNNNNYSLLLGSSAAIIALATIGVVSYKAYMQGAESIITKQINDIITTTKANNDQTAMLKSLKPIFEKCSTKQKVKFVALIIEELSLTSATIDELKKLI